MVLRGGLVSVVVGGGAATEPGAGIAVVIEKTAVVKAVTTGEMEAMGVALMGLNVVVEVVNMVLTAGVQVVKLGSVRPVGRALVVKRAAALSPPHHCIPDQCPTAPKQSSMHGCCAIARFPPSALPAKR